MADASGNSRVTGGLAADSIFRGEVEQAVSRHASDVMNRAPQRGHLDGPALRNRNRIEDLQNGPVM